MKTLLNTTAAILLILLAAACSKTANSDLLDLAGDDASLIAIARVDSILADQDVTIDDFRNLPVGLPQLLSVFDCSTVMFVAYDDEKSAVIGVLKNMDDALVSLKKMGDVSQIGDMTVAIAGRKIILIVDEKSGLLWGVNAIYPKDGVQIVKTMQNAASTPAAPWKRNYLTQAGNIGAIISAEGKNYGVKGSFDKNKAHLTFNAFEPDGKLFNIVEGSEYSTLGQCGYDMAADANIVVLSGKIDPEKFYSRIMSLIPEKYIEGLDIRPTNTNITPTGGSLFARITSRDIYNMANIKAILTSYFLTPEGATGWVDQILPLIERTGAKVTRSGSEAVVSMPSLCSAVFAAKDNVVSINLNNTDFTAREPLPATAADALAWLHFGVDKQLMAMLLPAGNASGVNLDVYVRPVSIDIDFELTDSGRTILQLLKR